MRYDISYSRNQNFKRISTVAKVTQLLSGSQVSNPDFKIMTLRKMNTIFIGKAGILDVTWNNDRIRTCGNMKEEYSKHSE